MSQTRTLRQKDKTQPSGPLEKSTPLPPSAPKLPQMANADILAAVLGLPTPSEVRKYMDGLERLGELTTQIGKNAINRFRRLERRVAALEQQRKGGTPLAARPRKKR